VPHVRPSVGGPKMMGAAPTIAFALSTRRFPRPEGVCVIAASEAIDGCPSFTQA
jgi:hypothetical protein